MKSPMLESYLSEIDRHLSHRLSVSDKSEIVTEIKSHLLEAQDKQPELSLKEHIDSMGEPREVANRYLLEKGLAPVPASEKRNIIKWLVIGFLGFVFLSFLFFTILLFKFTSMIRIDSDSERVTIDGILDIDGKSGKIFFGNDDGGTHFTAGKAKNTLSVDGIKTVQLKFNNGDIKVKSSALYENFQYNCQYMGRDSEPLEFKPLESRPDVLASESTVGVECTLRVPAHIEVDLDGTNGKVELKLDRHKNYNIRTKVGLGSLGRPPQSFSNGTLIKVDLENGAIEYD